MITNYEIVDGIKCYGKELAYENADFPKEGFHTLYELESKHFWFRSRNRIIRYLLEKHVGIQERKKILEIGCGTGFVLSELSKIKNYKLYGADSYLTGLKYAKQRVPDAYFIQLDARAIPFEGEFDVIGAFDVLEHLNEDLLIMENVYKALKKHGLFFITVPQHKWLWSNVDVISGHKRRYTKKEIISKLETCNFKVLYASSFMTGLLPLFMLSRLSRFGSNKELNLEAYNKSLCNELKVNPIVNCVLELITKCDELLIQAGVSIPFGSSMVVVARKINS